MNGTGFLSGGGGGGGCCAVPVRKRKLKSCKTTQHTLFCMNLSLDHSSSLPHSLKLYFFIEESEGSYQPPCEVFFFFLRNGQAAVSSQFNSTKCQDTMVSSVLIMWGYSNMETLTDCEMVSAFSAFLLSLINSEAQALIKLGLEETELDFLLL